MIEKLKTDLELAMISISALIVTLFFNVTGDVLPTVPEIIQEEGQFAFTDGSSVYLFYSDGTFFMEPTGLCGRTIEGSWNLDDSDRMQITGIWGWDNGISLINDKRRMTVYITLLSTQTENSDFLWRSDDTRVYDVYFIVEELINI